MCRICRNGVSVQHAWEDVEGRNRTRALKILPRSRTQWSAWIAVSLGLHMCDTCWKCKMEASGVQVGGWTPLGRHRDADRLGRTWRLRIQSMGRTSTTIRRNTWSKRTAVDDPTCVMVERRRGTKRRSLSRLKRRTETAQWSGELPAL